MDIIKDRKDKIEKLEKTERINKINRIFSRTDILLPVKGTDLSKWSVIACDQHTSEPAYWQDLENYVGDAPSTLCLMLPEAYLGRDSAEAEAEKINAAMESYLQSGIFQTLKDSYIYIERMLPSGAIRRGIVGVIDLDAYDYSSGSRSPVRATEGTVEDRLPPRVAVRKCAPLEMPHVMVFMNDPASSVFTLCSALAAAPEDPSSGPVYDFVLNSHGGSVSGWRLTGRDADSVDVAFNKLFAESVEDVLLAIGDGNHSLAAAKKCGDKYALVELVNIHDASIVFEPIHRVVFETDPEAFEREHGSRLLRLTQEGRSYGDTVRAAETLCQEYIHRYGGKIDYIHNDDTAVSMGSQEGCFAVLLPALDKKSLFLSVAQNGPYPKKSFSIGHADEKRFYLECRRRLL